MNKEAIMSVLDTTKSDIEAKQVLQGLKNAELKEIAAHYEVMIRGLKKADIVTKIVRMVVESRVRSEIIQGL